MSGLGFVLTAAVAAVLAFLLYRERTTLLPRLLAADPRRLIPVVLLYAVDLAVVALAWASIAHSFGVRTPLGRHMRIFAAANAARRLPGTLWYVGGRGALYARLGIPARPMLLASGVELALLWVSALAVSVPALFALVPRSRGLYGALALILLAALLNPWTLRWAVSRATRLRGGDVAVPLGRVYGWLILDIFAWILGGLMLYAVIGVFEPLALTAAPVVVAAWTVSATLAMLTFFLPSGLGVMELSLAALLAPVVSPGMAVLAAVAARLLVTALDVVSGLAAYVLEAAKKP